MCPRFESRWYHFERLHECSLFLWTFVTVMDATNTFFPQPWWSALDGVKPDRVAWIHEETLSPALVAETRPLMPQSCPLVELPIQGGEQLKQWEAIQDLLLQFQAWGLTRRSVVVTTGGGALSDAVGFAAAIWKRGMNVIHIPTTPLAAVDAAWGGKTGINWGGHKNQLGTFSEPLAVHLDARWMSTLPLREFRAGLAEVVKHALLDQEAFRVLRQQTPHWPPDLTEDHGQWSAFFFHSANVKRGIVSMDPEEQGQRSLLNLGHTVGHAAEALAAKDNTPWLHGEAVALGLHFALFESEALALSTAPSAEGAESDAAWIAAWLKAHVPLPTDWTFSASDLWRHMIHDKKNVGDEVRDVAWRGVGHAVWPASWKQDAFEATWRAFMRSYNTQEPSD